MDAELCRRAMLAASVESKWVCDMLHFLAAKTFHEEKSLDISQATLHRVARQD